MSGPRTSSNSSTSPGESASRWPQSVAAVAPTGRQQPVSPQVWNGIPSRLWLNVASARVANTTSASASIESSSAEFGSMRGATPATRGSTRVPLASQTFSSATEKHSQTRAFSPSSTR